jgi:hypothetical protein
MVKSSFSGVAECVRGVNSGGGPSGLESLPTKSFSQRTVIQTYQDAMMTRRLLLCESAGFLEDDLLPTNREAKLSERKQQPMESKEYIRSHSPSARLACMENSAA